MNDSKSTYLKLKFIFWFHIASLVLPAFAFDEEPTGIKLTAWVLVVMASLFYYLICLGKLVRVVDKKASLWTIATFITGPIGMVITLIRMRKIAKQKNWV